MHVFDFDKFDLANTEIHTVIHTTGRKLGVKKRDLPDEFAIDALNATYKRSGDYMSASGREIVGRVYKSESFAAPDAIIVWR